MVIQNEIDGVLARRLKNFTRLSPEESQALDLLETERVRNFGARENISLIGESPSSVAFILEGWASRYRDLGDGRRQLLSIAIPGDFDDINIWLLGKFDHSFSTITPVRAAMISRESIERVVGDHPQLANVFALNGLMMAAMERELAVSLGQRNATERLAHLFCELYVRMSMIGHINDGSFPLPLTQADLGEATGLSMVHVNRTLQELRANGLIVLKDKLLTIPRFESLASIADFTSDYLHLGRVQQVNSNGRPAEQRLSKRQE